MVRRLAVRHRWIMASRMVLSLQVVTTVVVMVMVAAHLATMRPIQIATMARMWMVVVIIMTLTKLVAAVESS